MKRFLTRPTTSTYGNNRAPAKTPVPSTSDSVLHVPTSASAAVTDSPSVQDGRLSTQEQTTLASFAWSPPMHPYVTGFMGSKASPVWTAAGLLAEKLENWATHVCLWCLEELMNSGNNNYKYKYK